METPDITPVQKLATGAVALLGAVLTALTAFGVDLTTEQVTAVLGLGTALGGFLVIADAVIRHGRAGLAATQASIDYDAYKENVYKENAQMAHALAASIGAGPEAEGDVSS